MKTTDRLNKLIAAAHRLGASDAKVILPAAIVIREELARLCGGAPGCEQFGLGAGCPPHVAGPAGFKVWQAESDHALVVRMDVPTAALFSDERLGVMQGLQEMVAGVEQEARAVGYPGAKGFAGGSCKQLFCGTHAACRVVTRGETCRYPARARPSMSGFGIDVGALMKSCGWPAQVARSDQAADAAAMTWVCGLVLISERGTG